MKRVFVLAILPFVLFALERVNLVKEHSFEKDSDLWSARAEGNGDLDSAIANRHDSVRACTGNYSAFTDTRKTPGQVWVSYIDSAIVIQGFYSNKVVSDIDSLFWAYSFIPLVDDSENDISYVAFIVLHVNAGKAEFRMPGYFMKASDLAGSPGLPYLCLEMSDFPADTNWHSTQKSIVEDLESWGIDPGASVDSIFVAAWGLFRPPWRGQKIYWDDVRLTGYADYDVGVKGILSGDSLDEDTPYTPIARIKNFGRENASDFSVIAEIFEGTTRVYYDSLPWSLTSDTEDTVTFAAFTPSGAANHTLIVRTSMSPDESDEDDEMTKTLYGSEIEEQPIPSELVFEVSSFTTSPRVSYSLPASEQGTITLYDPSGRRVESLAVRGSGQVSLKSGLSSGVYFIKLESGKVSITRKAVILR